MLLPGDATLAAAVASPDRHIHARLMVDWARNGAFAHAYSDLSSLIEGTPVLNRSLESNLPDTISLVDGQASASLTVALGGQRADDPLPIGAVLSPLRADSPLVGVTLAGAPVTYDIQVDGITVRQLTGVIRSVAVSSSLTATVTIADHAEITRAPVTLPPWAQLATNVAQRGRDNVATANSQWVIDHVLRKNGFFQSPANPAGTLISATLHGCVAAEVGYYDPLTSLVDTRADWVAGRFGLAKPKRAGAGFVRYYAPDASPAPGVTTGSWVLGAWVYVDVNAVTGTDAIVFFNALGRFEVRQTATTLTIGTFSSSTTPLSGIGTGWHHLALHFNGTSQVTTLLVDAVARTTVAAVPAANRFVTVYDTAPIQCVIAYDVPSGFVASTTSLPMTLTGRRAYLDPGVAELSALPEVVKADSWELLKDVVAAEAGTISYDEDGSARFRNRRTLAATGQAASVETVTADDNLADLGVSTSLDTIRNSVTNRPTRRELRRFVVYAQRTFQNPIIVPPGATVVTTFPITPGVLLASNGVPFTQPGSTYKKDLAYVDRNFMGVRAVGGADMNDTMISDPYAGLASVTVSVSQTSSGGGLLTVTCVGKSSKPVAEVALDFVGSAVVDHDGDEGGVEGFWQPRDRPYDIADNPWINEFKSAVALAADLADVLSLPIPVLDQVKVRGDPRRQLGDKVTLVDSGGLGQVAATVRDITREISREGGLVDSLVCRPYVAPRTV